MSGTSTYDGCPADSTAFLEKVARFGRTAANSPAFRACIRNLNVGTPGVTAKYMPECSPDDRSANEGPSSRMDKVLRLSQDPTQMRHLCRFNGVCGDGGLACAGDRIGEIIWADWLRVVTTASPPANDPWWPISQAAGTMWHEVMHTWSYWHPATCSTPGYDLQANTVPYIVGQCLEAVIGQSGVNCGSATRCGGDALPVISALGGTSCQCVKDPRTQGHDLALLGGNGWTTLPTLVLNHVEGGSGTLNSNVGWFGAAANNSTATKLLGDFNGDGRSDIALVGGQGWTSIPVAFSSGADGVFAPTNGVSEAFAARAAAAGAKKAVGDFNGDGKSDILVVGGAGTPGISVAHHDQGGVFRVTLVPSPIFSDLANNASAQLIVGDFNADGRSDFALVGGAGWSSVPVALSAAGEGSFNTSNFLVGDFPTWAGIGATVLGGDFNGDGQTDLALIGPPSSAWTSLPLAISRGNGDFTVVNSTLDGFPAWARAPGVRRAVADFNNDGIDDVAAFGGANWTSIPIAYGSANSSFTVTNREVLHFPAQAAQAGAKTVVGDFNRDGLADIAVMAGSSMVYIARAQTSGDGFFSVTSYNTTFGDWAMSPGVMAFAGGFKK